MLNPARSTVRHRSGKDYRKHSPRHQPPAVRVRRHWRTTVQGRIARPRHSKRSWNKFLRTSRSTLEWHNIQPTPHPRLPQALTVCRSPTPQPCLTIRYASPYLVHSLFHIRLMQRQNNSPSPNIHYYQVRLPPQYAFARHPDYLLRRLFATINRDSADFFFFASS